MLIPRLTTLFCRFGTHSVPLFSFLPNSTTLLCLQPIDRNNLTTRTDLFHACAWQPLGIETYTYPQWSIAQGSRPRARQYAGYTVSSVFIVRWPALLERKTSSPPSRVTLAKGRSAVLMACGTTRFFDGAEGSLRFLCRKKSRPREEPHPIRTLCGQWVSMCIGRRERGENSPQTKTLR